MLNDSYKVKLACGINNYESRSLCWAEVKGGSHCSGSIAFQHHRPCCILTKGKEFAFLWLEQLALLASLCYCYPSLRGLGKRVLLERCEKWWNMPASGQSEGVSHSIRLRRVCVTYMCELAITAIVSFVLIHLTVTRETHWVCIFTMSVVCTDSDGWRRQRGLASVSGSIHQGQRWTRTLWSDAVAAMDGQTESEMKEYDKNVADERWEADQIQICEKHKSF